MRERVLGLGKDIQWKMNVCFFEDLNIPEPDVNPVCNGDTQEEQTTAIMVSFERDLIINPAYLVVGVGYGGNY